MFNKSGRVYYSKYQERNYEEFKNYAFFILLVFIFMFRQIFYEEFNVGCVNKALL